MILEFLFAVILSVSISVVITFFSLKLSINIITKFISESENRFDQKLNLYKQLKEHDIRK